MADELVISCMILHLKKNFIKIIKYLLALKNISDLHAVERRNNRPVVSSRCWKRFGNLFQNLALYGQDPP